MEQPQPSQPVEEHDLDTAFSSSSNATDLDTWWNPNPDTAPAPQPEPPLASGVLAPEAESSNSYFDDAFQASLTIGPSADFVPDPAIVGTMATANEPAPASTSGDTGAPPSLSQTVVLVDDKDTPAGCVQFIDLTKENEEVLVLDTNPPRPSGRSRRTASSRKTINTVPENAVDPDSPVVIEEIRPAESSTSRRRTTRHAMRATLSSVGHQQHDLTIVLDDENPSTSHSQPAAYNFIPPAATTNHVASLPGLYRSSSNREASAEDLATAGQLPNKRLRTSEQDQDRYSISRIAEELMSVSRHAAASAAAMPPAPKPSSKPRFELQCPICLESLDELREHNKILMATLCGHVLCNSCMDSHFKASSKQKPFTCPTCRGKLSKSKIHNLYL